MGRRRQENHCAFFEAGGVCRGDRTENQLGLAHLQLLLLFDHGAQNILRQPMASQQGQRVRARVKVRALVSNHVDQEPVAQPGAGQNYQTVVRQYVAR